MVLYLKNQIKITITYDLNINMKYFVLSHRYYHLSSTILHTKTNNYNYNNNKEKGGKCK